LAYSYDTKTRPDLISGQFISICNRLIGDLDKRDFLPWEIGLADQGNFWLECPISFHFVPQLPVCVRHFSRFPGLFKGFKGFKGAKVCSAGLAPLNDAFATEYRNM
jgi:hypothetical protein